jgi:hypothetical protein
METRSPTLWVKPAPGASRSCVGANSVPRNSMKPSGYWCAAIAWSTMSCGSRLMNSMELSLPARSPPGPSTRRSTLLAAHVGEAEARVEQADERADGAGGVVVLGLGQQQRAAAFQVAQVDVVAERRADDPAAAVHRQHDLGFRVVPGGIGADADVGARAHRGQHRRLAEDLGVGPDAHFQVLRPEALLLQERFQAQGLGGSRLDGREVGADLRDHARTDFLCLARVAVSLLFDHALDQAGGEGHAGCLHHLQVARREEEGPGGIAQRFVAVGDDFLQAAQAPAGRFAHRTGGLRQVQQRAHGREFGREVVHAVFAQRDDAGALHGRVPDAGHQRAGVAVVRKEARCRQSQGMRIHGKGNSLIAACHEGIGACTWTIRTRRWCPSGVAGWRGSRH